MDIDDFERWWRTRDRADIEWIIDAVAATTDTTDGEIERLRATREVNRLLARSGRRRLACEVSHRVRLGVLEACAASGVRDDDPAGTTLVARAAGDAARGLVAAPDSPWCQALLRPFLAGAHLHVA